MARFINSLGSLFRRHSAPGLFLLVVLAVAMLALPAMGQAQDDAAPDEEATSPTAEDEVRAALDALAEARGQLEDIIATSAPVDGDEFALSQASAMEIVDRFGALNREMVAALEQLDASSEAHSATLQEFSESLRFQIRTYNRAIATTTGRIVDLRALRSSTDPENLSELESMVAAEQEHLTHVLESATGVAGILESSGIDAARELRQLDRALTARAEQLAGRLQLAVADRNRIDERIDNAHKAGAAEDELVDARHQLQAATLRLSNSAANLERTADLLATRGQDVTKYRQLAISKTGDVTESILDPKVLLGLVRSTLSDLGSWAKRNGATWGVRILLLILTVLATRLVAFLGWAVVRLLWTRSRSSRLLMDLVGRMIMPLATILGIVLGLAFLGVNPTTLLTGVGVLGVIVGLALQDSLSNLAAGFFILVYRPYDVDDIVRAGGEEGRVRAMGLANTTVVTFDNRRLFIPNRKIWQEVIENRSSEACRRVELEVRISYRDDLDAAIERIRKILAEHELVLDQPEPSVFVRGLRDSWLEIAVWPWARTSDWWTALTELPRTLRLGLAEAGIEAPYRRQQVEVSGDKSGSPRSPLPE